ncbi:TIGR04540 family protein [Clostridium sp.]|uniref:TIGR04540 family protein n=1 Tax=Clostridium sp. TaxID=1506 RepID=UPI002FCC66BB
MRVTYKNPKELAKCLKDQIDEYLDDIMEYEKLKAKITRIIETNEERFYKNGKVEGKIANVLGEERIEIINKILQDK